MPTCPSRGYLSISAVIAVRDRAAVRPIWTAPGPAGDRMLAVARLHLSGRRWRRIDHQCSRLSPPSKRHRRRHRGATGCCQGYVRHRGGRPHAGLCDDGDGAGADAGADVWRASGYRLWVAGILLALYASGGHCAADGLGGFRRNQRAQVRYFHGADAPLSAVVFFSTLLGLQRLHRIFTRRVLLLHHRSAHGGDCVV